MVERSLETSREVTGLVVAKKQTGSEEGGAM